MAEHGHNRKKTQNRGGTQQSKSRQQQKNNGGSNKTTAAATAALKQGTPARRDTPSTGTPGPGKQSPVKQSSVKPKGQAQTTAKPASKSGAAQPVSTRDAAVRLNDTARDRGPIDIKQPAKEAGIQTHAETGSRHLFSSGLHLPDIHEAIVPVSVIGGFAGMLAGTLPAAVWVFIFGFSFPPTYLCLPILIWLGLKVFKGFSGRKGAYVTAGFTLLGFYLTLLSSQAADMILQYKMSVFNLPLVTAAMIGRSGTLQDPVLSSAYILPLVFTVIGMFLVYELLMNDNKIRLKSK